MAEQVAANPVDVEHAAPPSAHEAKGESLIMRAVDGLWRLLRRPWLLVALLALLAATLLWARMVPQIPGQLTESPAEATRWFNSTLASTTMPGAALARTLGLFDLYASPWLRVLLALVTLLAAVQVADALGALQWWRQLDQQAFTGEAGEPAELARGGIARVRVALEESPDAAERAVRAWADAARFATVEGETKSIPTVEGAVQSSEETVERRLLLKRRSWSPWLAPLLALGALLAALLLWANVFWAWNLRPDVLAPGATFENARRGLAVPNQLHNAASDESVILFTGGSSEPLPIDGAWHRLDPLGWTRARASAATPAMIVEADDAILALPSAPVPQQQVGVLLPGLGSEQFIVLPGQGIGLRLVRISDGNEEQYWAEVYGEDSVQPMVRQQIRGAPALQIPLDETTLTLRISPARGLLIEVERGFGRWLWLPALLLILAGLVALILPARMLLAQISPWEKERTLLISQSPSAKEVTSLINATNP